MRFASLGTGSRGNATVVSSGSTNVLLDCGFSVREAERRLHRLGLTTDDLDAIVVTHEHGDHIGGVARLAARCAVTVYSSYGTAVKAGFQDLETLTHILSHAPFAIGDIEVQPYTVPHDAREPLQFCFSDGKSTLGTLTDVGHITPHILWTLSGCDALILETNHDPDMLARGPYHEALKRRVGGDYGHLGNDQAGELLQGLDCGRLQHLVAAHLSEQNNTPELARRALADSMGCEPDWVQIADQDHGLDWQSLA